MRERPCDGPECLEFKAEHNWMDPIGEICIFCGAEGPMSDWYADRAEEEDEKSWLEEQK